ncbi:Pfs domain-containing protein [Fusarium bulbicola]|nr:Pfs domain-containing protein [Fusarium bulbicola]
MHSTSLNLVVLYGAGGMGKTQIATEYMHRYHADYTSLFWIDGSHNYTAATDILDCIETLQRHYEIHGLRDRPWYDHIKETLDKRFEGLRRKTRQSSSASLSDTSDRSLRKMFLTWLSFDGNCGWLMIIDNVDDLDSFDFRDWLPPTLCGSIIMTSRRRDLALHWKSIEVDEMTIDESIELLNESSHAVPASHTAQEFEISQALGILSSYSFLKYSDGRLNRQRLYTVHPLIHFWTRHRMDNDSQKARARQTAKLLRTFSKKMESRGSFSPFGNLHIEHLLSIYEELYPCNIHPSDIINVPVRPPEVVIRNVSQDYSIASFVEGWLLGLRGWMDEFYFFVKAAYQSHEDYGHADYKLLYSLRQSTFFLRADTMHWILCQALKSYPPKHPRILEMIGNYAFSMSTHYENSDAAVSWNWWLLLAQIQILGPSHPATAGPYLGIGIASTDCEESLGVLLKACNIRIAALGYDDFLTRNALKGLASRFYECRDTRAAPKNVLSPFVGLIEARGVETANEIFGVQFVLFYHTLVAMDRDVALPIPMPTTWAPFLTILEALVDLSSYLDNESKRRWSRDNLEASFVLKKPSPSSRKEHEAWISAQPYLTGLHVITNTTYEVERLISLPPPELEMHISSYREKHYWSPDGWNWRFLLSLACTAAKRPDLSYDTSFLVGTDAEDDPSDQRPYFKWFDLLGPILLECVYIDNPKFLVPPTNFCILLLAGKLDILFNKASLTVS